MQVQRRQAQKSPQPKLQEVKKSSRDSKEVRTGQLVAEAEAPPISDEQKLELETAKRNLLDSLTKAAQDDGDKLEEPPVDAAHTGTEDQPGSAESGASTSELLEEPESGSSESVEALSNSREDGGGDQEEEGTSEAEEKEGEDASTSTQPNLISRLEAALESNVETQTKLKKLSEMVNVLGEVRDGIHMPSASVSQLDGSSFQIEDGFAQAALLGALTTVKDSDSESREVYQEAVQPTDSSDTATVDSIHVVGEIVATSLLTKPADAASTSDSKVGTAVDGLPAHSTTEQSLAATSAVVDASKIEDTTATSGGEKVAAKKSKRQLAASFMHNS